MTLVVYRLGKQRHAADHFSGLGGLHAHGRWTARGRPVVYTSESVSLAVLEYTLNYRRRGWVPASVLAHAEIPDDLHIETVNAALLPRNWDAAAPPLALQKLGEHWLERAVSAVLKVPSAVVVQEWNYLLNPRHPDFQKIRFTKPQPYTFDRRLVRSRKQ